MACRIEMIALHAHGEEADLDAFFDDVEKTIEAKAEEGKKLWPSLEFFTTDAGLFGGFDADEEDPWEEYVEPPSV